MLTLDFLADFHELLRVGLTNAGYSVDPGETLETTMLNYFNICIRAVYPRPRRVHEAAGLQCPAHWQVGYELLKAKFLAGEDVQPHQGRSLEKSASAFDMMLNDWGIQHFHLGERLNASGKMIEGTKELLFALVRDDDVYCLAFGDHTSWNDSSLLRIIHSNWPTELERFRYRGALGMERTISDAERAQLCKACIMVPIEIVPGEVFHPPGVGYTSSGHPIQAVRAMNQYKVKLQGFEDWLRSIEPDLRAGQLGRGITVPDPLPLRLDIMADQFVAVDEESKTRYQLGAHGLL